MAPTTAVNAIAASEVAIARRSTNAAARMRRGTMRIPPPTPNNAAKKPATRPMSRRSGTRPYRTSVGSADPIAELAREPAAAAVLLDVDGVLAPIVTRPEDAAVPEETRAELQRLLPRYGLLACISGRPEEDARRVVGLDGIRI